ncbi:MAG TPA: YwiC-like family protein [Anaeromyxobacter sp.]
MLLPVQSPPSAAPPGAPPSAPAPSLLPREHGAWGQLAFPLATGLNIGRPGPAAFLLGAAVVAAFFGHEPLLVVLGQRGGRARDAGGRRALRALAVAGIAAAALAVAGLWLSGPSARLAVLPALTLGAAAIVAASARLERTTAGELVVASALASCAAPVALAGGATTLAARSAALAWGAAFTAAILPVRAVLQRTRTRGDVDVRPLAALAVIGLQGVAITAAAHGVVAWAGALGILPMFAAGLAITALPLRAQRLTEVGWAIVGAGVATLLALVYGLRAA